MAESKPASPCDLSGEAPKDTEAVSRNRVETPAENEHVGKTYWEILNEISRLKKALSTAPMTRYTHGDEPPNG